MFRIGFSHAIFCFASATIALTACCSKVIYSLFRIFTHQLVVVWISASNGSVRFFICASTSFWTSSRSMDLMAASGKVYDDIGDGFLDFFTVHSHLPPRISCS